MSYFYENIEEFPPDPIFGLNAKFKADPRPGKCTFVTGYFYEETLKVPILESVLLAEKKLAETKIRKEYLPIEGDEAYIQLLGELIFGKYEERICGMQTVGGTGALHLIGRLATHWTHQIAISQPTWPNHWKIFLHAGLKTVAYPYVSKKALAFTELKKSLNSLTEKSCVLLHVSCHNPTGMDLSREHWEEILKLAEKKHFFLVLDMAYQGFSASPEEDAYPARLCLQKSIPFALTYTCAKNFSMYGERAGALFVIGESVKKMKAIRSNLMNEIRSTYSNPPMHPAFLVKGILSNEMLMKKWLSELEKMRKRMHEVRENFVEKMLQKNPEGGWETVRLGKGLFCYSGVSRKGVEVLREKDGFYIAENGRINLTGLNPHNMEAFTDALMKVLTL